MLLIIFPGAVDYLLQPPFSWDSQELSKILKMQWAACICQFPCTQSVFQYVCMHCMYEVFSMPAVHALEGRKARNCCISFNLFVTINTLLNNVCHRNCCQIKVFIVQVNKLYVCCKFESFTSWLHTFLKLWFTLFSHVWEVWFKVW